MIYSGSPSAGIASGALKKESTTSAGTDARSDKSTQGSGLYRPVVLERLRRTRVPHDVATQYQLRLKNRSLSWRRAFDSTVGKSRWRLAASHGQSHPALFVSHVSSPCQFITRSKIGGEIIPRHPLIDHVDMRAQSAHRADQCSAVMPASNASDLHGPLPHHQTTPAGQRLRAQIAFVRCARKCVPKPQYSASVALIWDDVSAKKRPT